MRKHCTQIQAPSMFQVLQRSALEAVCHRVLWPALLVLVIAPSVANAAGCHYFETESDTAGSKTLVQTEFGFVQLNSSVSTVYENGQFRYYAKPRGWPCKGRSCDVRQPHQDTMSIVVPNQLRLTQMGVSSWPNLVFGDAWERIVVDLSLNLDFLPGSIFRPPR